MIYNLFLSSTYNRLYRKENDLIDENTYACLSQEGFNKDDFIESE
jgi:hypothetical protein